MRRSSVGTIVLALVLSLALPAASIAGSNGKNSKKGKSGTVSDVHDDRPGDGIGKGGVPKLRDALVKTIHRVHYLGEEVEDLDDRLGDLEGEVGEGMDMLLEMIESMQMDLALLDERVAALEAEARDDDEDGFSENLGDCDDTDAAVNPLADEIPDNGIDDDCDYAVDEVDPMPTPLPEP